MKSTTFTAVALTVSLGVLASCNHSKTVAEREVPERQVKMMMGMTGDAECNGSDNLVANGSFEMQPMSVTGQSAITLASIVTPGGWQIGTVIPDHITGYHVQNTGPTYNLDNTAAAGTSGYTSRFFNTPEGNEFVALTENYPGTQSISQVVNLKPQAYHFSFLQSSDSYTAVAPGWAAITGAVNVSLIGPGIQNLITPTQFTVGMKTPWTRQSFDFTCTQTGPYTLTFASVLAPDGTLLACNIDDVRLCPKTVVTTNCVKALTPPGPFDYRADSGYLTVVTATPTCPWVATCSATWIHFPGGMSGVGSKSIPVSVDFNPTVIQYAVGHVPTNPFRSDIITVGSLTAQLRQRDQTHQISFIPN